jgi:hypothetical protein
MPGWIVIGWVAQCSWWWLYEMDSPLALAFSASVVLFCAGSFIKALTICIDHPANMPKLPRFVMVTSTAINAAWLTIEASIAILVAVAANSNASLYYMAVFLAVVVAALGVAMTLNQRSAAYSLTLLWGFWGIHSKQENGNILDVLAVSCVVVFGLLSAVVAVKSVAHGWKRAPAVGGARAADVEAGAPNEPLLEP